MLKSKAKMAASMTEPHLSEVDLDEDARQARARELERYHNLPVQGLAKEKELREVVLPSTPPYQDGGVNGSGREYPVDVHGHHQQGQPAKVTVSEQHVVHQPHQQQTKPKKPKRGVQIFSGFGRKGQKNVGVGVGDGAGEGHDGDHTVDMGYEKNGATIGQGRRQHEPDKPLTLTVYPNYLKRIPGILRIIQLIVGIIVCAAVNAERCIGNSAVGVVCGSASSPLWYGVLGGQGFVLFVAILFILGNFALIFYHICTRPKQNTQQPRQGLFSDKFRLGELGYNALAVLLYVIAAIVESWYASWTTLTIQSQLISAVVQQQVRNVYQPQWIAAAVFAWFNVLLYAADLLYNFIFR